MISSGGSVVIGFAICVLVLGLVNPSSAGSRSKDLKASARQNVRYGLLAQGEGRYPDAIAFYHQAYQLAPHPAILFNLGQAYRLKGDKLTAVAYYRKYIVTGSDQQLVGESRQWAELLTKELADEKQKVEEARRAGEARKAEEARRVGEARRALMEREEAKAPRRRTRSDRGVVR